MAGAMRKMAVYLGLVEHEDQYDEYDGVDAPTSTTATTTTAPERCRPSATGNRPRSAQRPQPPRAQRSGAAAASRARLG